MKALQHDPTSEFEAELNRAQVPILGYLVRLTGNLADARDLLQATNLTVWDKRDDFEKGSEFVAWMRTVALNHYRNESRKWQSRKTVPLLDADLEHMVEARHEEREKEESRKRRLLQVCLQKLPDRQKSVVEQFYLKGLSLEEVGESEGSKANAIAQLLHRARQNLIRCVRRESHRELDYEDFSDS